MIKYTFTRLCDPGRLTKEITESTIVTALDHIQTLSDPATTDVYFKGELSPADQSTLETLVTNHVSTPLPSEAMRVEVVADALQKDSENAPIQRLKMAPTGWTYKLRGIEFETSRTGIDSVDVDGAPRVDVVVRHFDAQGTELFSETQGYHHTDAVQTWLDWEPDHDYEIIGGSVKNLIKTTDDVRLFVIAVPDIPYEQGGSRIMVDNINFKYIASDDKVEADGRVSKRMYYNPVYHTNRLRFVFRHGPGAVNNFLIMLEFFKP